MHRSIHELVKLAKRENNPVRPYLYVNPYQGKHIPACPEDIYGMCSELARLVNSKYHDELLYVIGFAETATGIAAVISSFMNGAVFYQNTTRERNADDNYLFFTESHSHATDQLLWTKGLEDCIQRSNRIIFVDDEVTTGSTIYKLIDEISQRFDVNDIRFSIVSVLNSITPERMTELECKGIDCLCLAKIEHEYNRESIDDILFDINRNTTVPFCDTEYYDEMWFKAYLNPRRVIDFKEYMDENRKFAKVLEMELAGKHFHKLLLLGTEEFMYPSIYVGNHIKKSGIADEVRIHATTRSPIIASNTDGYPLFQRFQLRSVYEEARKTFIYNVDKYDKVIICTDADNSSGGISDLVNVLKKLGNSDILVARWQYEA